MRNFKIINFVFIAICANLRLSASVDIEFERKVLELDLENQQLRKTNAELAIETDKIKLELLDIRNKEQQLLKANKLIHLNCSGLATHVESMTETLQSLTEESQTFKQMIDGHLTEYDKQFKYTMEEKTPLVCIPKSCVKLPQDDEKLFAVACDAMRSNGNWTVIQRRMDGKTNFYRPWAAYRRGFGNVTGEFFVGLQSLHLVTSSRAYELLIEMEDFENEKRYAKYDVFEIDDEDEKYALKKLGTYSGNAGDSLDDHKSQKFSTYDQDNDAKENGNCAREYKGAWWYRSCHKSNLNGEYGNTDQGVLWSHFRGFENSLKFVEMKIRPKV